MSASATLTEVQAPAVRAVGLSRVSSVGDRSGSVVDQREAIERECERQGFALVDAFAEPNVSGGADLERRPGLRRAVEMVESGEADVVMVAFFDRLFPLAPRPAGGHGARRARRREAARAGCRRGRHPDGQHGAQRPHVRRLCAVLSPDGGRTHRESEGACSRAGPRSVPAPVVPAHGEGRRRSSTTRGRSGRCARRSGCASRGATIAEACAHLRKRGVKVSYGGLQSAFRSTLLLGELRFGPHVNEHAFAPVITAGAVPTAPEGAGPARAPLQVGAPAGPARGHALRQLRRGYAGRHDRRAPTRSTSARA